MAATTVTRPTLTDDTGDLVSGDVVNAAFFGANVYDVIDTIYSRQTSVFEGSTAGTRTVRLHNTNSGTSALMTLELGNSTSASLGQIQAFGGGYTTSGSAIANSLRILVNGAGGLTLGTSDAAGVVRFLTGVGVQVCQMTAGGDFVWGSAALATSATVGFPWIPSCAGAPSGSPTAPYTNAAALIADTTNNRLYVRVGTTWRYASLT